MSVGFLASENQLSAIQRYIKSTIASQLGVPAMDQSTFIRVKLMFRTKGKLAKLDRRTDKSLSSMASFKKLVYKHFPEIEETVEGPARKIGAVAPMHLLELKWKDSAGDFITVESDDDLHAMELSERNNLEFQIDVISMTSVLAHTVLRHEKSTGPFSSQMDISSSSNYSTNSKHIPCRYFQEGTCKYGETCRFSHALVERSSVGECRYFQNGTCKYGDNCRFSHALVERSLVGGSKLQLASSPKSPTFQQPTSWQSSHPSKEEGQDFNRWLKNQITLDASENIEHLSGETGLQSLSTIVQQSKLPSETITLFVELLAKEEIRSSLLRQKTNRIYGVLLGSPFLSQLHLHLASKFGIQNTKPNDVKSYVLLIEELQFRTTNGWKEVPLDAMHNAVSKLEESADKADLVAIADRLIEHRQKQKRSSAVAPPEKCLQGEAFRQMPIVASKEELLQSRQPDLPVNRVGMRYANVTEYLETHFQLLREDCIDPLRQGIREYRSRYNNAISNGASSSMQDLRVYLGVRLVAVRCADSGVEHVLSFHQPVGQNDAQPWESSKRLMIGALLCISSDQFQTFFWGVVARRDVKDLARGLVSIRLVGETEGNVTAGLYDGQTSVEAYVMVESTVAYFEAYHHVLKNLQRNEMKNIPFTPYLLQLEPKVRPPAYLLRRKGGDEYDFSSVFPEIKQKLGRSSIRVLQSEWPSGWAASLDIAQQAALKHALTKELAIVQGPPGTGKTFLGLLLVRILLANPKRSHYSNRASPNRTQQNVPVNDEEECNMAGPILVVCYTNHALDQFLEGIYQSETNLIRVGGRGKSEKLKERNLQNLLQAHRMDDGVQGIYRRLYGQARAQKDIFEKEIHACIDIMGTKLVTRTLLEEVATREQIDSLLPAGRSLFHANQVVEVWLNEASCVHPYLAHHFYSRGKWRHHQHHQQGHESTNVGESAEKPSRGCMKLLPTSTTPGNRDGEWIEVRRSRRSVRGAPQVSSAGDVSAEQIDKEAENSRLGGADAGMAHPQPHPAAEVAGNGRHRYAHEMIANGGGPDGEVILLQDFVDVPNVWQLNLSQRRKLHEYWLEEIRMKYSRKYRELTQQFEEACKAVTEVENEIQLSLLRKAKVVGMTTTAGAKHHDVLKSLKPEVVIVEEAAEVLEGHILACLGPSVKHLILIGDHLQLRPSVAVYRLSSELKLDVSMFERLVRSGVEHVTLQEQRRMRPNISKLVKNLYPRLRDHDSVYQYEAVAGVKHCLFFFDHKAEEENSLDAASKVNPTEAKLVVDFCLYLLNQGRYEPKNIVVLTMYTGQLQEIKKLLRQRGNSRFSVRAIGESTQDPGTEETDHLPRVSSVDDYQGEESDIIILSLVRSNKIVNHEGVGKIGFLKESNRICVALTRARKGLYIFGNADLLAERSTLWKEVIASLRDDGALGPQLELYCQNHRDTITRISKVEDFKQVEDGGCSLACDYQLDCGHVCPRRCHHGSHDLIFCPKPCLRQYDECSHKCTLRCHGAEHCPPCTVVVTKELPRCKHEQGMKCSKDVKDELCRRACPIGLKCGHQCRMLCGRPCTKLCEERVMKVLPCGHSAKMPCHEIPESFSCKLPCGALLPECNHPCQGSCGSCKQGTEHVSCGKKCGRTLPCGHLCEAGCSISCPPCTKKCQKRCFHSRCSKDCGYTCKPCLEPCAWQCEHYKCEKRCHEPCSRPRCNSPCPRKLPGCGHSCIGLCGEPCPTQCRVCHPETLDIITLMTLGEYEESDRFIELEDCGHLFEVDGLDTWMDGNEAASQSNGSVAIKLRECPECKTIIWRTHRYSNVVKAKQAQVEEVKKKIHGHELTRQGNLLLEQGENAVAWSLFRNALRQNPGMMEAHFGAGCAFLAGKKYEKAITHWSFILERSSFADETGCVSMITKARGREFPSGSIEKSTSRAGDSIATQTILQWASALSERREFTDAIKLCDALLARDPENQPAARRLKETAEKRHVVRMVVKAMGAEVGEKGHWYTCPNGHYYTIGECGGAMQVSRCPDCKAEVGGGSHRLVEGNKHSDIDGSLQSAWPM